MSRLDSAVVKFNSYSFNLFKCNAVKLDELHLGTVVNKTPARHHCRIIVDRSGPRSDVQCSPMKCTITKYH